MKPRWTLAVLLMLSCTASAWQTAPSRGSQPPVRQEQSDGDQTVSPSVIASSVTRRDPSGLVSVDILILWRGSPGWMFRRTGSASSSGGGSSPAGTRSFSLYQGGLHLTATFDPASRTATVLGERVDLKDANVVLVDRVDSPDGPVIVKTTTAPPTTSASPNIETVLRNTPELLDYLRCEAQIPGGLSHPSMGPVCSEAVVTGKVNAPSNVTPVPTGPVTNRAAGVAPPPPDRVMPPGAMSLGNGVLSGSVAGGWFVRAEPAGAMSLDLLVLWRGSPGWPLQRSLGGSGGGSSGSRRGMTVRYGDRSFYAAFDTGPRRYQIEDDIQPLGDDNVVLVDDVDSAGGLRVVKTLRVDPAMSAQVRIDEVIARSPELVAYLRCDAKVPDARQQMAVDILCARYRGR